MMFAADETLTIPEELLIALRDSSQAGVLVVGIGSAHTGDSVGWQLADLIAQRECPGVEVRRALVPLDLLDWMDDYSVIHLIDAMQSAPDGALVRHWHWPACEELVSCGTTSHGFDLISVLRLATALGRTRANIFIWGAGMDFSS